MKTMYEYKEQANIYLGKVEPLDKFLNRMSEEGWELVNMRHTDAGGMEDISWPDYDTCLFRRPKKD